MIPATLLRRLRDLRRRPTQRRIGVVAVAKNEAPIMAEWIAVHAEAGFTRLFVYDNGSTDRSAAVIARAAREVDVRRIPWPSDVTSYQGDAYDDCAARFGGDLDWLAFIDMDEFLVSPQGLSIDELLPLNGAAAAVAVNWQLYGSSGHAAPPGGLVTEAYTRRADTDFFPNRHVKSIVRPAAFRRCVNPHFMDVRGAYADVDGRPMRWDSDGVAAGVYGTERLRVNHYFTRSRADWDAKRARGHRGAQRTAEEFAIYDRNEVDDPCAAALGAQARRRFRFLRAETGAA